jgi:hypothetical protein
MWHTDKSSGNLERIPALKIATTTLSRIASKRRRVVRRHHHRGTIRQIDDDRRRRWNDGAVKRRWSENAVKRRWNDNVDKNTMKASDESVEKQRGVVKNKKRRTEKHEICWNVFEVFEVMKKSDVVF